LPVEVITRPAEWRRALDDHRAAGRRVGLVPTMGALHAGHLSLVRRAGGDCDVVAVTNYVNPLQFGPTEDLATYPRDLERDAALAAEAGAELMFAPTPDELWRSARVTTVTVAGVTERLEGERRPGHFDGVTTIVAKLFGLSGPCHAYFGEKDFQQLVAVRRLVADLDLPVEVIGCPTVRDSDGLALSSRNTYLDDHHRRLAPQLYYALLAGKRAVEDDAARDPDRVEAVMAASLARHREFSLDYAAVARPDDLGRPARIDSEVRLLMAARLGPARLIDNVAAQPPTPDRA
jgi:pantoate--beta-alanine ligase